ncbi:MAG: sigma-70 family RNA polymerase sigma factor [Acidimicrobiia bacterium]
MDDLDDLATRFEEHRDHLRSVARRMLGSAGEAEDAVQEAWFRLHRTDSSGLDNLGGWLTTVVSRVCLDMLRSRDSRREDLGDVGTVSDRESGAEERSGPEQEAMLADAVGGALSVVLDTLSPAERVAFVLHDLFGVGFDEIGRTVQRSPVAARKLASRARRQVRGAAGASHEGGVGEQRRVVDAFLSAARHGDLEGLIAVLAPDVVFWADESAAAMGDAPARVEGAPSVAAVFSGRARAARSAMVDGEVGVVVEPAGRLIVILDFVIIDDKIVAIDAIAEPTRLARADVAAFDD